MHLNEQDIAKASEALTKGTYHKLNKRIKDHLAACDSCAHEVQTISTLLDDETPHQQTKRKTSLIKLSISIAASALLAFAGWQIFQQPNIENTPLVKTNTTQDTIECVPQKIDEQVAEQIKEEEVSIIPVKKAQENNDLLAYQSHKELEVLVKRFEEGAMRGEDIKILSPTTLEGTKNAISICWDNPEKEELIIEFFDNKGTKLFEITSQDNHYQVSLKKLGLYYYKILNKDFDMIFCGRIKIIE